MGWVMSWEDLEAKRSGYDANRAKAEAQSDEIATMFSGVFDTPAGKKLLDWLKAQTINQIGGPDVSSDVLRHMEGQRYVVALMDMYVKRGREVSK